MYPTFPPALNSDASLSLYHKNNKRVSMGGGERGGCCRQNDFDFLKKKSEIKKEMFKTKHNNNKK